VDRLGATLGPRPVLVRHTDRRTTISRCARKETPSVGACVRLAKRYPGGLETSDPKADFPWQAATLVTTVGGTAWNSQILNESRSDGEFGWGGTPAITQRWCLEVLLSAKRNHPLLGKAKGYIDSR